MFEQMTRHWWVLAMRGVFALLFGVAALVWPGITVLALVILFGLYALVDGAGALVEAVRGGPGQARGWLALSGVAGIAIGVAALVWPGMTGLALLMLIAAWAVVTGVLEIVAAIALRKEIRGEWLYALTGLVSIAFGILLFAWPVSGALALVGLIGLFSILFGAMLIGAAFRLRRLGERARQGRGPAGASAAHS